MYINKKFFKLKETTIIKYAYFCNVFGMLHLYIPAMSLQYYIATCNIATLLQYI